MVLYQWKGDSLVAEATYAIGDIHGEMTLLKSLIELLPLQPEDLLVFVGDYMDRGEDSVATVLFLAQLAQERPCIFLRGNHDESWLEWWNGECFTRCPYIPGARKVWEKHKGLIPYAVGKFLEKTRLSYEDGLAYYSHAGAQPGIPFEQTPDEVLTWGYHDFLSHPYNWGKPVVFGHYEYEVPLITDTKICMDTAGYRTGVLSAVRMNDRAIFRAIRS
jgi:serine/threonine protein phosphatase 1